MTLPRLSMSLPSVTIATALALGACAAAAPAPADAPPPGAQVQRLLVRSVADWPTPAAFAERVAAVAGVALRDVSTVAPRQFALSLVCADATSCAAAQRRLAAEHDLVLEVRVDARRRLPVRPAPAGSP